MKTLRILVIAFIILGFGFESTKGQVPQQSIYQAEKAIKSISIGDWDKTLRLRNTSGIYRLNGCIPARIDIAGRSDFALIETIENHYYLLEKLTLADPNWTSLTVKPSNSGLGVADPFNLKWKILTGNSTDATRAYYSHSTRMNKPNISDNQAYRMAATFFHFYTDAKYPSLNAPK